MVFDFNSYRSFLREKFAERYQSNSSYSIRAFARDLDISKTTLSDVLNKKSHFSNATTDKVAKKLLKDNLSRKYFSLLVQVESCRDIETKEILTDRLQELRPKKSAAILDVDKFKAIAEWYHFAILEYFELDKASTDPTIIAKELSITKTQVMMALDRLVRLGLLKLEKGRYINTDERIQVGSKEKSSALRRFHCDLLDKAKEAIHEQSSEERIIATETIAIDPQYLDEARSAMEKYFDELIKIKNKSVSPSEVYLFAVQSFRLTNNNGRKK